MMDGKRLVAVLYIDTDDNTDRSDAT